MTLDWGMTLVSVTDGDTIRAHLHRTVPLAPGWESAIRSTGTKGTPIRLTILDTPERGQPGYLDAAADLAGWLHGRTLRVETYESAGWDRLLGDIYVDGDRGDTATQHMLRLGWDPYVKG